MKRHKYFTTVLLMVACLTLLGCSSSRGEAAEPTPMQLPLYSEEKQAEILEKAKQKKTQGPVQLIRRTPNPDDPILKQLLLSLDADPDIGPAPLKVQFALEILYDEVEKPRFEWSFGDGSPPGKEQNPVHVFEKPGNYTIFVRVFDDAQGRSGSETIEVEVEAPE